MRCKMHFFFFFLQTMDNWCTMLLYFIIKRFQKKKKKNFIFRAYVNRIVHLFAIPHLAINNLAFNVYFILLSHYYVLLVLGKLYVTA